jgi:hypothetical protein
MVEYLSKHLTLLQLAADYTPLSSALKKVMF